MPKRLAALTPHCSMVNCIHPDTSSFLQNKGITMTRPYYSYSEHDSYERLNNTLTFKYCNPVKLLNTTGTSTPHCSQFRRSRRKQAPTGQALCLKSCSQLAAWLEFKLESWIPKPTLITIMLGGAGTWMVSWRAGYSDVTTAIIIWLSDLEGTFQFALEVPGCFLSPTCLMEASISRTIILPLEWLLGNKVVCVQEQAQAPCWETRGLRLLEKPHSEKTSISSHLGHLMGNHLPFG